jgi:hypothetical protein
VHRSAESSQHVLGLVPGSSVKPKPSLPIFFFGWLRTPGSLDRLQINLLSAPLDPHVVDIRAGRTCAPMRPGRTGFFFLPTTTGPVCASLLDQVATSGASR